MASEYEAQAQAWATKWGVEMVVKFTGHRKYFADDTDTRDTYSVTLRRGNPWDTRSMTFDFGTSLVDSKLRPESDGPYWRRVQSNPNPVNSHNPAKHPNGVAKVPTLYDVLTRLEKYEPETHEEWCRVLGYDPDSRKALETYLIVQKQARDFRGLCGNDAEMLREAQEIR